MPMILDKAATVFRPLLYHAGRVITTSGVFFFGGVTATAPSRDLTDNKKKEEGGIKQRRKQEETAQGDPEPGKGNQEKEKDPRRVLS
jgi:hypothetical protein